MASVYQSAANIANAPKSTGARTGQGRHRTRLNACRNTCLNPCLNPHRHDVTGQICLLTDDQYETFDQHCTGLGALRGRTQAARQPALEEAQLLAQLAYSKGEKHHPASDFPLELLPIGSVYSSAGISRPTVGRAQCLAQSLPNSQTGNPRRRLNGKAEEIGPSRNVPSTGML
jgi:hypothetical protein